MDFSTLTDDQHLQTILAIVTSSYYKEQIVSLESFMFLTRHRFCYRDPEVMLGTQDTFAKRLIKLKNVNQEGLRNVRALKEANRQSEVRAHEEKLACNRYIMRVTQMVADGLAYRLLGFDRPVIRMSAAQDKNDGSVDLEVAYAGMRQAAEHLMRDNGSRILFNDLTNVLRVGDLTELLPDGRVLFHELKKNGGKVINVASVAQRRAKDPNTKVSKQTERLIKVQFARDLGRVYLDDLDDGFVEIHDVKLPFRNYIDDVARVIRAARQQVTADKTIGDFLHIRCTSLDAASEQGDDAPVAQLNPPNWPDEELQLPTSNYTTCFTENNEYARNMTPYSIFPLSNRDCLDLMTGRLLLSARVNVASIARMFRERGWDASVFSDEEIYVRMEAYTQAMQQSRDKLLTSHSIPALHIRRGAFNLEIPLTAVLRVGLDFMCPTMLIADAEYCYRTSTPGDTQWRENFFLGEQRVWF